MKLKNIKPGTKLVWNAPEPYQGYARKGLFKKEGRVYYTCIVTNKKSTNSLLTHHLQTIGNTFHWMSENNDYEYLRLPTEEELNTLEFPKMKDYEKI